MNKVGGWEMQSSTKGVLIRRKEELFFVKENWGAEALCLCTRRELCGKAEIFGLNALLLSENLLDRDHSSMNEWSCRQAIDLVERTKMRGGNESALFEANFYTIKGIFVQTLKFVRVLDRVLREQRLTNLDCFEDPSSLLVQVVKEHLAECCFSLTVHPDCGRTSATMLTKKSDFKLLCRKILGCILDAVARWGMAFSSSEERPWILVSGALNHLAPAVLKLCAMRRWRPFFFESHFNLEKFLFCLRYGIPQRVLSDENRSVSVPECADKDFFEPGQIVFAGVDYVRIFNRLFRYALRGGLIRFDVDSVRVQELFRKTRPVAVFLDEDLSLMRRTLAVTGWGIGVESFVVSHGIPLVLMRRELGRDKHFRSSVTFVNSDLEKTAYENLFFDPTRVVVTGIPRYDEIFLLRKSLREPPKVVKMRRKILLLTLSGYHNYDFEDFMPVLVCADSIQEMNRAYIQDVLKFAVDRPDISVVIKPHYVGDRERVLELVKRLGVNVCCRVVSFRENIFKLQSQADVVITAESTVIGEAGMFEKPVIIMNYTGLDLTLPFERSELVRHVTSREALSRELAKALESRKGGVRAASFFSAFADGLNTQRVVDVLTSYLESQKISKHDLRDRTCVT